MGRRNWRGYAEFEMPTGDREAIMTVCPGNPEQAKLFTSNVSGIGLGHLAPPRK